MHSGLVKEDSASEYSVLNRAFREPQIQDIDLDFLKQIFWKSTEQKRVPRLKAEHKQTTESVDVNSLRSISKEEMKREASKPLYLARYE